VQVAYHHTRRSWIGSATTGGTGCFTILLTMRNKCQTGQADQQTASEYLRHSNMEMGPLIELKT